jgi:hypothetical protein
VTACPICGDRAAVALDHRPRVPLLQNRVWPDRDSALRAPAGELRMVFCPVCHFAWNDAFDPAATLYDGAYDNDQTQSGYFRGHVDDMQQRIMATVPHGRAVPLVEVGCGQGAFLRALATAHPGRFSSLIGFDPAWRGAAGPAGDDIVVWPCYFDARTAAKVGAPVEVVVSRHTIEHVPDPLTFLRSIRACMAATPDARLFLETPDIAWILAHFQPQDFFYEHCSLFSPQSLAAALATAGFDVVRLETVFEGQYLWAEARPATTAGKPEPWRADAKLVDDAVRFGRHRDHFIAKWRADIGRRSREGAVWIWGGASKGVTFTLLVDPDAKRLAGAIDLNERKSGCYLPVTGVPIAAPDVLRDNDSVIVMNPNYHDEIVELILSMSRRVEVLGLF